MLKLHPSIRIISMDYKRMCKDILFEKPEDAKSILEKKYSNFILSHDSETGTSIITDKKGFEIIRIVSKEKESWIKKISKLLSIKK